VPFVAPSACGVRARQRDSEQNASEKKRLRGSPPWHHALSAIGSIRLASLFLTRPTRMLTGQHVIPSDG
jgi:hypothetical protein